jgi:single-strand DNA-binding protein
MNLNRVQLAGRLTRDPENRYTASGVAIADFSIAVSRSWKNDRGEKVEETDFIDCTAFSKTAEIIQEHLHKGSPIYVEGRLKLDQWQDKTTNQPRSKIKVIIESMQFVGPRQTEATAATPPQRQATPVPRPAAARPVAKSQPIPDRDLDPAAEPDDVPFRSTIYRDVRRSRLNRRIL